MYIYDCRLYQERPLGSLKKKLIHVFNALMILLSLFCMVAGTYAAIKMIDDHVKDGKTSRPFSCADNSK